MKNTRFSTVKVNAERKACLRLLLLLIVQTLLVYTNALPAKSGPSSKSLDFVGLSSSPSKEVSSNTVTSEENHANETSVPYKITVYPWNNHLGRPAPIAWTQDEVNERVCKEIPSRWQGKVRSVHTHNNCVVMFSRHNCEGNFKVLKIGSPSHNRLSDICFQRKPISARPCTQAEKDAPI